MTGFKYFKNTENFENCPAACEILAREKLVLDAKFLPVLEAAENGNLMALLELQNSFAYGENGISKNYKMARYYSDMLLKETSTCPILSQTPQLYFEALRASAYLEFNSDNLDRAKFELIEAMGIMKKHLHKKKWDMQLLNLTNSLTV